MELLISQPLLFTPIIPFSPTFYPHNTVFSHHPSKWFPCGKNKRKYILLSSLRLFSASRKEEEGGLVRCNEYLSRQPSTQCAPCERATPKSETSQSETSCHLRFSDNMMSQGLGNYQDQERERGRLA